MITNIERSRVVVSRSEDIMFRTFFFSLILITLTSAGQAAEPIRIRLSAGLASGSALEKTAREFAQSANRRLTNLAHVEIIQNGPLDSLKKLAIGGTELALLPSALALDVSKKSELAVFDLPFFLQRLARGASASRKSSRG
jgi:TRAP-type C4-dicarboxylate transport system substrate-binding protein